MQNKQKTNLFGILEKVKTTFPGALHFKPSLFPLPLNFHFQVRAKFTVDDYSHYLFTPRILTQWVLGLFRYDLAGGKSLTWFSLIKQF